MNFQMFDNFFNRFWENKTVFDVNIFDNEDNYVIEAYLAGIDKKNINITYENDELSIEVIQEDTIMNNIRKKEFERYIDKRSFIIPNIIINKSKSKYVDGKLTITLPKQKEFIAKNNTIYIE